MLREVGGVLPEPRLAHRRDDDAPRRVRTPDEVHGRREHRFPGFLHITRDLTEAVEGQSRARDAERTLSEALLP